MLQNLVNLISKSVNLTQTTNQISKVSRESYNPFTDNQTNNPFLTSTFGSSSYYGKNQPVEGGYFAGYYNGRPNIVGRRLFIEV